MVLDPENFIQHIEWVFKNPQEEEEAQQAMSKAKMRDGQKWQEFFPHWDGLLSKAGGNSYPDHAKIVLLRERLSTSFSSAIWNVTFKTSYAEYTSQVGELAARYEATETFKELRRKRWPKGFFKGPQGNSSFTSNPQASGGSTGARRDADGDVIMGQSGTGPSKRKEKRAAWVSKEVLEDRKKSGLCYRCGGSGHRSPACPYLAAIRPMGKGPATSTIATASTFVPPVLEEESNEEFESAVESGNE